MAIFNDVPRVSEPTNRQLLNYLYSLEEEIRYCINHLGGENLVAGSIGAEQLDEGIKKTIEDADGNITQLRVEAGRIAARVEDAEGDISSLTQTAQGLETRVQSAEGDISTLEQTAQGLSTRVQSAEGDISSLEQTASGLTTRVTNAEGDISSLTQTAQGLETRVTNTEGDISGLEQTASGLSTRVGTAEGNISTLSQTAQGLNTRVTNAEGDISELTQTAQGLEYTVGNLKFGGRNYIPALTDSIVTQRMTYAYDWSTGAYTLTATGTGGFSQIYKSGIPCTALAGKECIFHADRISSSRAAAEPRALLNFFNSAGTDVGGGVSIHKGDLDSTFTVPAGAATLRLILRADQNQAQAAGETVTISGVMLELGNKASDWTPNPDDRQGGGSNILRGTDWGKALQSQGVWADGTWRKAGTQGSQAIISVTDAPIGMIKYGGSFPSSGQDVDFGQGGVPIIGGQTYTLSCYARGTGILAFTYGNSPYYRKTFNLSGETAWARYHWTFIAEAQANGLTSVYVGNYLGNGTLQVCGLKMEAGNTASDWTPSPQDPVETLDNTSVSITTQGMRVKTTGYFIVDAGGNVDIQSGGDLSIASGGTGSIDLLDGGGSVSAQSALFNSLTVNGKQIGQNAYLVDKRVVFTQGASSPPAGHDFIWMNASGTSISRLQSSRSTQEFSPKWFSYASPRTYTLNAPGGTMAGGPFTYTLTFRIGNRQTADEILMKGTVTITCNGKTLTGTFGPFNNVPRYRYRDVEVTWANENTNLFSANTAPSITIQGTYDSKPMDFDTATPMTLTAQRNDTSGAQDITVRYVP